MKPLLFLATFVALAACTQNPTAPSANSVTPPNLSELRAARNPSTTGQPTASCELSPTHPPGFDNSAGFAHAETVYAGGSNSNSNPDNPHAVSQYDVACYQLSSK